MGGRSGAERRALRRLERQVFGAPAVPPGRFTAVGVALRRRLLGAHRAGAPPALQVLEALLAPMDSRVLATLVALGIPDLLDAPV